MHDSDPNFDTDVDILLRALHRADQNWPNREDLERYWDENRHFRTFESIEEAELAVQKFHERDIAESDIRRIGWNVREKAVGVFLDSHANTKDSFARSSAEYIINQLMSTGSFNSLRLFLDDILEIGVDKAVKKHRAVDRGSKSGHIFAGFLALVEIAVLLLVLNACEHGFQTIVICALGIIYSIVAFQNLTSNDFNVKHFATVLGQAYRVRYLLKDSGFKREETEEEFLQLNKTLAKSQVRYWISAVKLCLI